MALKEIRVKGYASVGLATKLLQRARVADAEAGFWEAADVQWWWRKPRRSDELEQLFWTDDDGPVAAVLLTDFGRAWQCDPVVVPGVSSIALSTVWARAAEAIDELRPEAVEVFARDDDLGSVELLHRAGFVANSPSGIAWMNADDRAEVVNLPEGFVLVDRADETIKPHPMRRRNGEGIEARLRQCSLYDPAIDVAVEAADGRVAGSALFWFDPVTEVGLVEPMRVEDEYQRRGLARAMLTSGLDRLARLGARRIKVGYSSDAAGALYSGVGFRLTSTTTTYLLAAGTPAPPHPPK
jgi:predicted N-acetyltransferase YhbS